MKTRAFFKLLFLGMPILFFTALAFGNTPVIPDAGPEVTGTAYLSGSKQLVYRETHFYSADRLTHRVEYRDSQGEWLAEKTIDYRTGLTTPEFEITHIPMKQRRKIYWSQGNITVTSQILEADKQSVAQIRPRYPLVIDAGFDTFIRKHWNTLTQGNSFEFYFPLPQRAKLIRLKVRQIPCSIPAIERHCFQLLPANAFLRLITEPVELGYRLLDRRLIHYRGLSNIEDKHGEDLHVDIFYEYRKSTPSCCHRPLVM